MIRDIFICLGKEFRFYFQSRIMYVLLAVYNLICGGVVFYFSDFMTNTTLNLRQLFVYQPEILSVLIPVLTMRLWADEIKQNTWEILLTQPVSVISIVTAKFLAAWSATAILIVSSAGIWLAVALFEPLYNWWIIINYLQTIWLAGALCAIAFTAAAFCYNSAAAFLSGLVGCLVLVMSGIGTWMAHWAPDNQFWMYWSEAFDYVRLYHNMIDGQVGVAPLVYSVLLIGVALWMATTAVSYKRN